MLASALEAAFSKCSQLMHQSFVTTAPPTYGDGWGTVGLMCGAVTFWVPQQCHDRSPQWRAFSRALMDEKLLSLLFPVGGGGGARGKWLQMTRFRAKKMFLCNNSYQTCFSDTLTSAGPLGMCWNPHLSDSGFNTSLGAQQMLMHRKSCLISIAIDYKCDNNTTDDNMHFTCLRKCTKTTCILAYLVDPMKWTYL